MMYHSPLHVIKDRFETQMEAEEADAYMALQVSSFGNKTTLAYRVTHEETGLEFRVETSEHSTRVKYTFELNKRGNHQEVSLEVPPNRIVKSLNHLVEFYKTSLVLQKVG